MHEGVQNGCGFGNFESNVATLVMHRHELAMFLAIKSSNIEGDVETLWTQRCNIGANKGARQPTLRTTYDVGWAMP